MLYAMKREFYLKYRRFLIAQHYILAFISSFGFIKFKKRETARVLKLKLGLAVLPRSSRWPILSGSRT